MKVLIISGSHPRHEFILRDVITQYSQIKFEIIVMQRESLLPKYPMKDQNPTPAQQKLFSYHFKLRQKIEGDFFGNRNLSSHTKLPNVNISVVTQDQLNSFFVHRIIESFGANACIVMGAGMLTQDTLNLLPKETFNIHLGLSPKYRGSATLFWPTYLMDPFSTGITFHRINAQPDAGDILHQTLPDFKRNFTLHETAIAAISAGKRDLDRLFDMFLVKSTLKSSPQPIVGKTFLTTDFRIAHLELIYNFYDDHVLDAVWPSNSILPLPKLRIPNLTSK